MDIIYRGENEIRVRYFFEHLPQNKGLHGFTLREYAGSYDVFIDPALPPDAQQRALEHELEHIERGDFEREDEPDVSELELSI